MALYFIQTFKSPDRMSLVSNVVLPSHIAAIEEARQLLREGESAEVWYGEKLIYRMMHEAPSAERSNTIQPTRSRVRQQPQPLQNASAYFGQKWSIFGLKPRAAP